MATRICKGNKFVLKEFRQVVEDMKIISSRSSLSIAGLDYARGELLRGAAESGNALRLKLLLRSFQWSEEEVTAALLAVASRRTAIIIARARPDVFQASATYAVQEALRKERLQALRGLLDAGASPVAPSGYLDETPLHTAATFSNSSCTVELLERGADPDARDKNGETPVHRAARHGRPAVLSVLLSHGGARVNALCLSKETPLCYAIYYRHAHCVDVLLENGADVKIKNALGLTPLHTAVSANDHIALVHLLLKWNADPEAQTNSGLRPMHYAATAGNYKAIWLLVNAGADPRARTWEGDTALHIAASANSTACLEVLVQTGADLHARDRRGLSPLHVATAAGRVEALRELLRLGAHIELQVVSSVGRGFTLATPSITPLMIAVQRRDEACGRALIEAGADIPARYLTLLKHIQRPQNPRED